MRGYPRLASTLANICWAILSVFRIRSYVHDTGHYGSGNSNSIGGSKEIWYPTWSFRWTLRSQRSLLGLLSNLLSLFDTMLLVHDIRQNVKIPPVSAGRCPKQQTVWMTKCIVTDANSLKKLFNR